MNWRLLTCAAIACSATPAFAHAFLNDADPAAGATLHSPPKRVVLMFSEKLEGAFSGVTVVDRAGQNVEAGPAVTRGNSIAVALRPLISGRYRVVWHAVSVDTHRTEGAYSFVVKP